MAYRPQPCETYFVESHDQCAQRSPPDYVRMMGGRKQQAMTDELSRQASEAYMEEIVDHMKIMETATLPDVASIEIQQEIQWFMRPYLIDFLIEAHAAFQLLPETLFLAVNLLDRYCSRRVVYKRHYQLVGCASLLIAAKYGDKKDRVPMIRELKSMCCSLYDEEMFTQMEWHVLNTLEWQIGHPSADTWLQLALKDGPMYEDDTVEHMALYLCEIALYHKEFVSKRSSVMARATLALSRGVLGRHDLECNEFEVQQVLLELSRKLDRPSQVLYKKYASPQMSRVAIALDQFIRHQEMMARAASPPTPPIEHRLHKSVSQELYPGTPQKQPFGNVVNGYMTPPITPEGDCFNGADAHEMYPRNYDQVPRCPVTPSPTGYNPYVQQPYNSYHEIRMR